uniref:Uncharacterized protein n=1 Tax=Anguilla anguilla TaxID=7936 RepID=A0A0E9V3M9_ANGAN
MITVLCSLCISTLTLTQGVDRVTASSCSETFHM